MADLLPEYFTFTYPRRSSDFCLRAVRGPRAIFGVADMIGHPRGLRWRNYMRVMNRQLAHSLRAAAHADVAALTDFLREQLLWHSRQIHNFRVTHDRAAFGFCLAMAATHGSDCRVVWLGDCRAYRVRRGGVDSASGDRQFDVTCLTRDHNALGEAVGSNAGFTLFQNEMIEKSKQLGAFLGIDNDDLVARLLLEAVTPVDLTSEDCLFLMTDGIYMPHLRAQMDSANFRLSTATYYLEEWFRNLLVAADRRIPADEANYWPEIGTILVEETLRYAAKRRQYLDDMAITGVYMAPPE
jgi:serine/threonine protein phosphatase PrpC